MTPPTPPEIASHVATVTLFGTPSDHVLYGNTERRRLSSTQLYKPKPLELCTSGDAICGDGGSTVTHALDSINGMMS
ncbi:cutinase family protein [Mycobacterium uberis]|uniref:cutinase family protein n=1 Tax=Mycobacterium uberis TaxID=2162698 RepID=UPI001A9E2117